jgi:hypothetical protein
MFQHRNSAPAGQNSTIKAPFSLWPVKSNLEGFVSEMIRDGASLLAFLGQRFVHLTSLLSMCQVQYGIKENRLIVPVKAFISSFLIWELNL